MAAESTTETTIVADTMEFADYFPIWNRLTRDQQAALSAGLIQRTLEKGSFLSGGGEECTGLLLIRSGQLRAFLVSDEGREITLYRLFERDLCLFSASCMMNSIQFDILIQAEKDTELWVIPARLYRQIMEESAPAASFTNEVMASRFSQVMWLIEQILWKSMDRRIAAFLLEEAGNEQTETLRITHETIANHLGTHREVVTRLLRYFQNEGMVQLSRGTILLSDIEKLEALAEAEN